MSREISDLTPETQALYHQFDAKMKEAGIDYIVTCTYRSQSEQDALYAQGRTTPGKIVTWTHHSKHTERTAFDIVIMENGKPDWNTNNPGWQIAGDIGKLIGLDWGGFWVKKKDYPHFQLPEN
jgi:peptidoglycan LD-endopeptidase CwlK